MRTLAGASVFMPALGWMVGWLPLRLHVDVRALGVGPVQTTTFALAWWGRARRHVMGEVLRGLLTGSTFFRAPVHRTVQLEVGFDRSCLLLLFFWTKVGEWRWACHVAVVSTRFRVCVMTDRPAATASAQ